MKTRCLFCCLLLPLLVCGQAKKLPIINLDRRTNTAYVDSLIEIGHENLQRVQGLKPSAINDSLKLQGWAYLANLFRYRSGQRDSVLHYADKLIAYAQLYERPYFEQQGIYYKLLFYQITQPNYPKALQLCHQALQLIEKHPHLKKERWRYQIAMGEMFIKLEQYPKALASLMAVQHEFETLNDAQKAVIDRFKFQYANVLQQIGNTYRIVKRFDESEKYLLAAIGQIVPASNATSLYYLYSDLAELYYFMNQYQKANEYYLKAEAEAIKINNLNQKRYVWAWLAEVQQKLNNHELALEYAQKSIPQGSLLITQRIGHRVLGEVYEAKKDWENALVHYKEFRKISDSLLARRRLTESLNLQNQFELDQLALQSRQAQELQAQKMLAFRKQTEIDRLKAKATTDQLRSEAQKNTLQNQLQTEALKTQAQKTEQAQQAQINRLKISELDKQLTLENRTQNFLIGSLVFLILMGIVLLKLNSKLKSQNVQLAAKNREITEALLKGQTTERRRVAAELHDNLGGLLGALKMTTNVLDASTLHPQEQEIYGQIVKMIDEANVQIRSLSHNMLPEQLEKQGLVASLETLVSKLNLGQKTKFSLEVSGLKNRLEKQVEFNLYTIVLELCNNILKHANATEAYLELHQKSDMLHLLVTDNGSGFDPQSSTNGMGLENLKERASATGGELKIRSLKGEGTVVSLKISQPIRVESQI